MAVAVGCPWFDEIEEYPDILDEVDFIEVAGWRIDPDVEPPHRPIVLHNLDRDWSMAAVDAIDPGWPERLRSAIEYTRTPWFSMHMGFASEQVRFDGHMLPESEPLDRRELMARIVEVTNEARLHCPLQVLLENLDYGPEGAYEHICEPEFMAEVLEMTGAGLLFDLAHWRVSASWLGFDPLDALDRLPMHRAVEIHLSSPRQIGDGSDRLEDRHDVLEADDFELLEAVFKRASPRAVTIEYSRDTARLSEQIAEVRTFIAHFDELDTRIPAK